MNCKEIEQVLHGYLDGELDLVRSLEIEQHLKNCPACAKAHRERQLLRTAIAGGSLYFNAPKGLERRVRSAVRQASGSESRQDSPRWRWNWNWPAIFLPVGAAALVILIALPLMTRQSAHDRLAEEIVSAHLRSLMANTPHLTDVASSDQHTVKPWFTGKLPFSPAVTDFSVQGFPLVGGRLDFIGEHQAAALVYQRRKHVINLFIWPEKKGPSGELRTRQGYNIVYWNQGGMAYWTISDVTVEDLREFQKLVKHDLSAKEA